MQHQINFGDDWGFYAALASQLVYLSGFPQGWLTEFSYTLVDARDIPSEERRGWRTVLLKLMGRGVISWEQVVEEFGHSDGLNSERWMIHTEPYRNRNSTRAIQRNLDNQMEEF